MEDARTHLPSQLSGGEQQRVAIARALVNDPKIILADEPTGNLDAENQRVVFRLLSDLHAQGRTIVMVTHDENAGRLADRRLNLEHGRIKEKLIFSAEENQDFDEVLEHLWMRQETRGHIESHDFTEAQWRRLIATMAQIGLVAVKDGEERFTMAGEARARDVIRRHRLAERLFMDVLSIRDEAEIESSAVQIRTYSEPGSDGPDVHAAGPSDGVPARQPDSAWRMLCGAARARESRSEESEVRSQNDVLTGAARTHSNNQRRQRRMKCNDMHWTCSGALPLRLRLVLHWPLRAMSRTPVRLIRKR